MLDGPAMVLVWLLTPAMAVIGSFGIGLAMASLAGFWETAREEKAADRSRPEGLAAPSASS